MYSSTGAAGFPCDSAHLHGFISSPHMVAERRIINGMVTGAQVRAARALLDLSQQALASEAGVTRVTLTTLESGRRLAYDATVQKVVAVLEARGISFVDDETVVGVLVDREKLRRQSGP